ncbi:MBOAT, membrane-bound O-acyltransferase family-domain-containing protein [Lipomyces oligophaga]|uniref:MBOAT, membrane-bound O-acyltransferase family-domain-containing protein n=1 Tax=Lipomyces oligophaga TaxID=45792 RepID=UPI0034CEE1CC
MSHISTNNASLLEVTKSTTVTNSAQLTTTDSIQRNLRKDELQVVDQVDADDGEIHSKVKAAESTRRVNFSHIYPIHSVSRASILSRESTTPAPSFVGFRNLGMIILLFGNVRLAIENYQKYGVLIRFSNFGISRSDLYWSTVLTATIPLHLFVAVVIERMVAMPTLKYISLLRQNVKKGDGRTPLKPRQKYLWRLAVVLHSINAIVCLVFATVIVYTRIDHPLIGTPCELHALILCLKVASFALTNRDLRETLLTPVASVPTLYNTATYPSNLTFKNVAYFWWAPTLVYQPVYPRSPSFRPMFFAKRVLEIVASTFMMYFLTVQYAVPILENSLSHIHNVHIFGITERLFKLGTMCMIIWLFGFFSVFQSGLNALAEVMKFGDREFYDDWWNSRSVGEYWRLWNKPVTNYFRRHIYVPLVRRGWNSRSASFMVFFVSAILHEIAVGVPTHHINGTAFWLMLLQIPLIQVTAPFEKITNPSTGTIGNCIFWFSFFIGQPTGLLIYYFTWNLNHGKLQNLVNES